jgi:DNA recombination protein RmuC
LATLAKHFGKVRRGLDSAVQAYNEAVGSLERSVLPSARRFKEHGAASGELPLLEPVEHSVRVLQAPELVGFDELEPADVPRAADAA